MFQRFEANLPRWLRAYLPKWAEDDAGKEMPASRAERIVLWWANRLLGTGVIALPGTQPAGDPARVSLEDRAGADAWARDRFVARAGSKRSSERGAAELERMLEALAESCPFPAALDSVAGEFVDEELPRVWVEWVTGYPGYHGNRESYLGGARHALEVKGDSLIARYRRRQDLIAAAATSLVYAEPDGMLQDRCAAFL